MYGTKHISNVSRVHTTVQIVQEVVIFATFFIADKHLLSAPQWTTMQAELEALERSS